MKNKKIFLPLFLLLVVGVFILIYQRQTDANTNSNSSAYTYMDADKVKVKIGQSKQYSKDELNAAVETVKKEFKDYEGCTMTDIWYSETESHSISKDYMQYGGGMDNGVNEKNVLVLLSTFKVDSTGGDGSWEPNSTQSDFSWTLIRDSKKGKWRVDDSGY
ncbi:hypothetical protein [Bacillus sp. AFS017336]|uniref:hypothetical protein n=1 Tax=Bacillus sp. AFS017336 TaxID=2033489 RepID=UPI001C54D3BD|nr:hypothetical protein [Bacillus sp. AFS017336]